MIEGTLAVVAPLFLMAGVGYLLNRTSLKLDTESIGRLVLWIGTPSLVFSSLTSPKFSAVALTTTVQAAIAVVLLAAVFSALSLIVLRQPVRTFLPSLTVPNSGNMGLPVLLLAFGEEGLAVGVAYFFVIAIIQHTISPMIVIGEMNIRRVFKEPLIYSVMAVIFFRVTGFTPHPILIDTTRILGGMMIPLMVILLGYSLATLKVSDMILSVKLAVARLLIGMASGSAIIWAFGLEGVVAGSVFLMASMPSAIIIYIFALRYDKAPRRIAGLIVVSTVMTFLALPFLLWIARDISESRNPLLAPFM